MINWRREMRKTVAVDFIITGNNSSTHFEMDNI